MNIQHFRRTSVECVERRRTHVTRPYIRDEETPGQSAPMCRGLPSFQQEIEDIPWSSIEPETSHHCQTPG